MSTWLTIELALIPTLLSALGGLVWLVRLEAQGKNNAAGIQRSDEHIQEGTEVRVDIGVLKNDVASIKEDHKEDYGEIRADIRAIKEVLIQLSLNQKE